MGGLADVAGNGLRHRRTLYCRGSSPTIWASACRSRGGLFCTSHRLGKIVAIGQGTYAFAPAFFGLLLTEAPGQTGAVDNLAYRGPRNRSLSDAAG